MKTPRFLLHAALRQRARDLWRCLAAPLPQAGVALFCTLALAVGTLRTQAVPSRSSPVAISAANLLVSVNPDANTISVFDASVATPVKLGEVAVGRDPSSIAISPSGATAYVANAADGTVSVVDLATRAVTATVNAGAEPMALVLSPNGTRLYVANSAANNLMVFNTATPTPTLVATVDLSAFGTAPRAIAVTDDGDSDDTDETIFVSLFYAQLRPGKTFLDEGQDDQREGRVVAISAATSTVLGTTALLPIANAGFNSNGQLAPAPGQVPAVPQTNPQAFTTPTAAFPNQLAGLAIRPTDQTRAYVVSTAASPNGPVRFNQNMHGLISVLNTVTRAEITAAQTDPTVRRTAPLNLNQGVNLATTPAPRFFNSNPTAIAWRPDGSDAWITVQQSDLLLRMTVDANGIPSINAPLVAGPSTIVRVDLQGGAIPGKAPRGVVINSAGTRAYVLNYVSRSISVVDISNPTAPSIAASVQATALPAPNTPDAVAQLGAEMFFSGRGPNGGLASEAWGSCAACHPGGRADNVTWMFDGGPRQTIALDGTFGPLHQKSLQRILNWSAVRDEVHDFELNSRNVSGGRGIIDDDRLFLAFGGASGATPNDTNLIEQFQQFTGAVGTNNDLTATPLPKLPSERRDFAIATAPDGHVFIIGGRSGAGQGTLVSGSDTVLEFNPRNNTLQPRSSTGFTPRHSFGAAVVRTSAGIRIYAVGGYAGTVGTELPVATVEEFNPAADTWRTVASLPTAVAQFGITVAGGINTAEPLQLIHVVSGNTGSESAPSVTNPNPVQRFQADPAGPGAWTPFNPAGLTLSRNHGVATALRGVSSRVFVIGGQDSSGTVITNVEEYLAQAVTVVNTPHIGIPGPQGGRARFGIASSLSTQQIYVMGGIDRFGSDQSSILEYSVANNGPTPGPAGTPSGAWVTRGNLSAARRGLQISTPPGVVNFLPVANTGRSAAQDALAEFVRLRLRPAKAPVPATDPNAQAGRTLFGTTGLVQPGFSCATCHGGPNWTRSIVDYTAPPSPNTGLGLGNQQVIGAELRRTDTQPNTPGPVAPPQAPGVLLNVGTFTLGGGRVNEVRANAADISQAVAPLGANGFNVPSLLSVHEGAPYFYSGLAQTLDQVLDGSQDGNGGVRHHFVVNATQRAQLIAFLRSIDDTTPIFPGSPGDTTITCSSNIVIECTGGLTPVTYTVTAVNANGPVPVTCVPPSGTGFRLGTSNVVCTASGATSPCNFTVTVVDTLAPTLTCSTNITAAATNAAGTVVNYTAGAFDACGIAAFQCVPPPGTNYPVGTTTVTCTASDPSHNTNSCSFTVTVAPFDTTRPQVLGLSGTLDLNKIVVRFSEVVSQGTAEDRFNYGVSGGVSVSSAVRDATGSNVTLTVNPPLDLNSFYTVTINGVQDLAGNEIAPNSQSSFRSFDVSCGFLAFESFDTGPGNNVSDLTGSPNFPNNPRETLYMAGFNTRSVYPDDSHENYGARIRGYFIPEFSGNWIFYLRSDDASQLFLNPTGDDPAGRVLITEETTCCNPFSAHASAPQALVAGQRYYIEALYKEGTGVDYCQVAAKLDTDPTPPNSLSPLSGAQVAALADPTGVSLNINQQPADQVFVNQYALLNENFNSSDGGFTVTTPIAYDGPWVYEAASGSWRQDGQASEDTHPNTSLLNSPVINVPAAGNLSLTFVHRYSFEFDGTRWDGGQVRISVNGGPFNAVPDAAFTQNGYGGNTVAPNSASELKGQPAFTAESPSYASGFITSIANLGAFNAGDTVRVQFIAAGDTNTRGQVPNWQIDSVLLAASGTPPPVFSVTASATVPGLTNPPFFYQWDRNCGSGFRPIPGANGSNYTFIPTVADNGCRFRVRIYIPGAIAISDSALLTVTDASVTAINCSTNIVAECTGGLTPVTYSVTASNAIGPVPVICVPPSGTGFRLGTSNVVCTASNANGSASCSFTVTVVDTQAPTLTCSTNITAVATNAAGTVVNYTAGAFDACGIASFRCVPPPGTNYPIGTTTVTCTASDPSRNTNSCSFFVTVLSPNRCPLATNLVVSVAAGSSTNFQLRAGDPDGNPLQYAVTQAPQHGTLVVQIQTGAATYSPNSGYCGPDSFKFRVSDGICTSAVATVSINVDCGLRPKKRQVLAELIALRAATSDDSDQEHLDDAIEHIQESLANSLWLDDNHLVAKKGKKVFDEEEDAVDELKDLREDAEDHDTHIPKAVIQNFIDRLVLIDRTLAVISVDEAEAAGANPKKIKEDRDEIKDGDEDADDEDEDDAIKHYRDAWAHAVKLKVTGHAAMPSPLGFRLHFAGLAGELYVLEVSPDFVHWTPLADITADAEGNIDYTDTDAAAHPSRFYRVKQPE